jgi:uncharacterized membrane protein
MKWLCVALIIVCIVLIAACLHGRMWFNAAAFAMNGLTLGVNLRTLRKG